MRCNFILLPMLVARRDVPFLVGSGQVPQIGTGAVLTFKNLDGPAHAGLHAPTGMIIGSVRTTLADRMHGGFSEAKLGAAAVIVTNGPAGPDLLVRRAVSASPVRLMTLQVEWAASRSNSAPTGQSGL